MLWGVSGTKTQCQVRESTWRNDCERILPQWGIRDTRRAAEGARTKSERGWHCEGLKDCTVLKRVDDLVPAAGPGRGRPGRSTPAPTRGARSYRSARVRPQILEVGAVNGLQGLQLMGLSLRVALWRLVPATPGDPAAPGHRNAPATAGPARGGGGARGPGSSARLGSRA